MMKKIIRESSVYSGISERKEDEYVVFEVYYV